MFVFVIDLGWAGTWDLVRARKADSAPTLPTAAERRGYTSLVRDLARAAPSGVVPDALGGRAAALGLDLVRDDGVAWLVETTGHVRGVGVVGFRLGPLLEDLVVQAPHPFTDKHTGAIVAAMFDAGELRAACVATVRRDSGPDADPAHTPTGWLQAATDGLADALDDPLFVQLHGFAASTADADAVVSSGRARPPRESIGAVAEQVGIGLGATDVRTGYDIPALAARRNAQGRLLAGRARFLHVELSARMREGLKEDASRRAALADTLLLLAEGES